MDLETTAHAVPEADTAGVVTPAPPNEREVGVLQRLLAAVHVDGIAQLRDQVRMIQVAPGSDATCRMYVLHPEAPRSGFSHDDRCRIPGSFPVRTPQGRLVGEVLVWVDHGHLRALQYVLHNGRQGLVLPPPAWVEVPAPEAPASVQAIGAVHALEGVRTIGDLPRSSPTAASHAQRAPWLRVAAVALALVVIALASAAFFVARSNSADLDAARGEGAAAGSADGAAFGELIGTYSGSIEGPLAGRGSTYQPTFDATNQRVLARARRDKLEQREADAAAALASENPSPSTCIGYRVSNGPWVCA